MKRLVLGFSLSLLLLLKTSTNAQDNKAAGDDSSAVRATVTNYIEAYYTGDAHRMSVAASTSMSSTPTAISNRLRRTMREGLRSGS